MIVSFVLIELGVGFDVVSVKIIVIKDGDYYVVNGIKCYIINVNKVSVFILMVCFNLDIKGVKGIIVFVVLVDFLGIIIGKLEKKMG